METILFISRIIVILSVLYEIITRLDTYRKHRRLLEQDWTDRIDTKQYIDIDMKENLRTTIALLVLFFGIGYSQVVPQDTIVTAVILVVFGLFLGLSANARREKDKIIKKP
jgi:hypothetical protein